MATEIKSARIGTIVCKRESAKDEWKPTQYASISQAKRANGTNAIKVQTLSALPPRVES